MVVITARRSVATGVPFEAAAWTDEQTDRQMDGQTDVGDRRRAV